MNPFCATKDDSVAEWGEKRLIEAIRNWLGAASPPSPAGIGDDCAVFLPTPGSESLVTTDPIFWGRHFDKSVSPEAAAGKLFKRNLSDIAAMGGRPRIAVVSLFLPGSTSRKWLEGFHRGLRETSERFKVPVAGGDVSQTEGLLGACMTLVGETVAGRALTRNGAAPGDEIFVTGRLGGSLLGHHCSFVPRLAEGEWLAKRPEVTAAMDLSDGLGKDLPALLPAGCEVDLFPARIPLSAAASTMSSNTGHPALFHALCDGEDYELVIAVRGGAERLLREWSQNFTIPLTRIGIIRERSPESTEPLLKGLPEEVGREIGGYEHFR